MLVMHGHETQKKLMRWVVLGIITVIPLVHVFANRRQKKMNNNP